MIHIEKDSIIIENSTLRVASPTGDYDDNTLIEFYDIANPSVSIGAFQAQYIKYGNMVYAHNGHMELGAAILKIDPGSTHSSASYVRMSKELLSQMNGGSLESTSLEEVIDVEKKSIEEQINKTPEKAEVIPEEPKAEEPVAPAPEEVLPEVPVETPIETPVTPEVPVETPVETPVTPEVVVPPAEVSGEVIEETIVAPPVVEEVVPESLVPTVEEVLNEVIPEIESVLPEPVAKLIRKAKAKKKKLA